MGNVAQQGCDVGGLDDFQKLVAGIVFQPAYLGGCVIEGQALFRCEVGDALSVEAFFSLNLETGLVAVMDESHDAPEVVHPVGVEEVHAPACLGRRKSAEEEGVCMGWQKGLKRVVLGGHVGCTVMRLYGCAVFLQFDNLQFDN